MRFSLFILIEYHSHRSSVNCSGIVVICPGVLSENCRVF